MRTEVETPCDPAALEASRINLAVSATDMTEDCAEDPFLGMLNLGWKVEVTIRGMWNRERCEMESKVEVPGGSYELRRTRHILFASCENLKM